MKIFLFFLLTTSVFLNGGDGSGDGDSSSLEESHLATRQPHNSTPCRA